MIKTKKVFKYPKPNTKKEKLLKPVETDRDGYRNDMSEYHALLETISKPPPRITHHKEIFN